METPFREMELQKYVSRSAALQPSACVPDAMGDLLLTYDYTQYVLHGS